MTLVWDPTPISVLRDHFSVIVIDAAQLQSTSALADQETVTPEIGGSAAGDSVTITFQVAHYPTRYIV